MASRGGFFLAWPGLAGRPPSPKAAAAAAAFRISTAPRPARECEITCFCPLSRAPQLLRRPRVCSHATPPGRRPLRSMAGLPCQCVSPRRPVVSCLGSGWPTSEQTTTPTQVAAVGCAHPHHTCPFAAAPRCGAQSSTNFYAPLAWICTPSVIGLFAFPSSRRFRSAILVRVVEVCRLCCATNLVSSMEYLLPSFLLACLLTFVAYCSSACRR